MIGFIVAMQDEVCDLMKDTFKDIFVHVINEQKFYIVTTKNDQMALLSFSGIGKVNAAMTASIMINSFNVDSIINIGSGGIFKNLSVLDVLIGDRTSYADVDVTGFNYEINQVPKMPKSYEFDQSLNNKIIKTLNMGEIEYKLGYIYTTDSFINSKNYKNYHIIETDVPTILDMECCAIAQVCYKTNTPMAAIKIGIDKLMQPITNEEQFNNNLLIVSQKIDKIIISLIDMLSYFKN